MFQQPKYLVVGVPAQFGFMPLLGYFIAKMFGLRPELTAGLILLGACPGGTASNVITYLACAHVELSVTLALVSTLPAPLLTPWLTWLYAHTTVNVDIVTLMADVVRIVVIPLVGGLLVRSFFTRWIESV